MEVVDPAFHRAGGLSVAVISPDEKRRNAALHALGECQTGPIQEFASYPPDLDDAPRTLNRDFDVVLVDLDSDPEYALESGKEHLYQWLGNRNGLFGAGRSRPAAQIHACRRS